MYGLVSNIKIMLFLNEVSTMEGYGLKHLAATLQTSDVPIVVEYIYSTFPCKLTNPVVCFFSEESGFELKFSVFCSPLKDHHVHFTITCFSPLLRNPMVVMSAPTNSASNRVIKLSPATLKLCNGHILCPLHGVLAIANFRGI